MSIDRTIPVVAATCQGRLLLLLRSKWNKYPWEWCIPGGKIERGESPVVAAHRELMEETGLDAQRLSFVASIKGITRPDLEFAVFQCDVEEKHSVINLEGHTFCGYGWFRPQQVSQLAAMEPANEVVRILKECY